MNLLELIVLLFVAKMIGSGGKTLTVTVFSGIIRVIKNPDGISLPRGWQPKGLGYTIDSIFGVLKIQSFGSRRGIL